MHSNKPKRILIIRNAWEMGGAEKYNLNLSIILKKNGFTPIIVTRLPELIEGAKNNGIIVQKGLWHSAQGWSRIYRIIRPIAILWYTFIIIRHRIDIVHAQSRDDFIFSTPPAYLLRKKIVWTDHGDLKYIVVPSAPNNLKKFVIKNAKRTRAVIAVSNSEKNEILKSCKDFPNLKVVHNGVLKNEDHSRIERHSKYVIGATSRLVKSKGIAELIIGFSNIKELANSELWLVGDGEDKDFFKDLVSKLGIARKVKYFGFQKNVWPYLNSMDVFVHPSYHEAFCLSIIEAAMAAKPIIATNTGGNPEIVDKTNGILVPIKDSQSITLAIDKMLSNQNQRLSMGKNAKEVAYEKFDFEKIVHERIIPLYLNEGNT